VSLIDYWRITADVFRARLILREALPSEARGRRLRGMTADTPCAFVDGNRKERNLPVRRQPLKPLPTLFEPRNTAPA